ncbi:DUF4183 domain-containing protein [Paenibacillus methanolicus]|uniref:DUF4183 domain-containing protein n=1 Tax=Paenibacillus methanolicus TaxID=582686 RepID=UPI0016530902|nr:DUF4183 domain-containing protein [Paenibacillus methanolicus]
MQTKVYLFYAIADGAKREYRDEDGVDGYGRTNRIPNPRDMSLIQTFVNAVLQPANMYRIRAGSIRFLSEDIPQKGVPIIVQSIRIMA